MDQWLYHIATGAVVTVTAVAVGAYTYRNRTKKIKIKLTDSDIDRHLDEILGPSPRSKNEKLNYATMK